jgi:hypothetical protein
MLPCCGYMVKMFLTTYVGRPALLGPAFLQVVALDGILCAKHSAFECDQYDRSEYGYDEAVEVETTNASVTEEGHDKPADHSSYDAGNHVEYDALLALHNH